MYVFNLEISKLFVLKLSYNSPSLRTKILSDMYLVTFMSWETKIIDIPNSSLTRLTVFKTCACIEISREETISSHKSILGFSKSDLAILILCNCPPDSSLILRDKTFLGNSTNSRTFKSLLFLFPIL